MLGLGSNLISSKNKKLFLPTDIGEPLVLWLKNDTKISAAKWEDSSENNNHASQTSSGDQATVVNGGLDFEGSEEDHYDLTSAITIPTADGSTGGHYVGIVIKIESDDLNTFLSSDTQEFMEFQTNDKVRINYSGTESVLLPSTLNLFSTGAKMLVTVIRDNNGAHLIFKDGVELTYSGSAANTTNTGTIEIDAVGCRNKTTADRFFDGVIYELVVANAELSRANIENINSYLVNKHGL